MTKALRKNTRRSISGSLGRYIAILLIIMLGVAFLTGLRDTRPIMSATETAYVKNTKLYDLRLISTIGFDADDVAAVQKADGVVAAAGSVNADFIWQHDNKERVYRAHMLTDNINEPVLTAGRMPENGSECLIDSSRFSEGMIGQTIEISDSNDEDTKKNFKYSTYTVVGLADSPLYIHTLRGTTSLGDGTLQGFVLIPEDGFDFEYYTELYVTCTDEFPLYSDDYDDYINTFSDTVEAAATASVNARFDRLTSDGKAEISDAENELNDKKAEAETELADAKTQLDDAKETITSGETELADAKKQLDDAKAQLDAGAEQIQPGFTSWESALQSGFDAYYSGKQQLEDALAESQAQIDAGYAQLQENEKLYTEKYAEFTSGKEQYEAGLAAAKDARTQIDAARADLTEKKAQLTAGFAALDEAQAQLDAVKDMLDPAEAEAQQTALDTQRAALNQNQTQLDDAEAVLNEQDAALTAQEAQLTETGKQLDEAETALSQMRTLLDVGQNDYTDGIAQLEYQRKTQTAKLDEAYNSLITFQNGIKEYNEGLASYNDGVKELADGKAEYEDGLKDYEDGKKEFDEQISDAEQKIADAKQELADLKKPELYVLTRDTNAGYVSFESDSTIVEKLSGLFPIFFFLIAALVCSTTMTRMIDDERTQIGTLRALGYSRGSILAKYLLYSGSAAALGCVIGYFAGGYVFPFVIWTAYGMLYSIPGFVILYDPVLFVIALAASLLCSAGTTYLALRIEMQNMPANLIRPKTPAAGKRIFLERITPLWKRLKFLHKVSLRNIFRFKKRMIMMILGIAGCTALVLTGFGIHDSVANIANFQFDDIQKYDVSAQFSDTLTEDKINEVESDHKSELDAATAVQMTSGDVTGDSITKSAYIVASDDPAITDIFDLHIDGETVPYPGKGEVLLTEKLAELTDIKTGDTVTVSVSDTEKAELKVAGLVENYVQNYLYMTGETYAMVADKGYEPKTLLLRVNDSADEYALSAALSKTDGVSSVSVVTDTRNMIDQMMQSLNYVVALVLISAGALAFIVLFNLGNINLTERVREIATIKVLGFHSKETGAYVFRENIILSMMGIVVGLPLGVLLHTFVLMQIRVDMVSFKAVIAPVSFLLTVVMVVLFTVITDLVMRKKIAKIDMAESLKSIE